MPERPASVLFSALTLYCVAVALGQVALARFEHISRELIVQYLLLCTISWGSFRILIKYSQQPHHRRMLCIVNAIFLICFSLFKIYHPFFHKIKIHISDIHLPLLHYTVLLLNILLVWELSTIFSPCLFFGFWIGIRAHLWSLKGHSHEKMHMFFWSNSAESNK